MPSPSPFLQRSIESLHAILGNQLDRATPTELEHIFRALAEITPSPIRQEASKTALHYHEAIHAQAKTLDLLFAHLKTVARSETPERPSRN